MGTDNPGQTAEKDYNNGSQGSFFVHTFTSPQYSGLKYPGYSFPGQVTYLLVGKITQEMFLLLSIH